jgi:hypothetical protein
LYTISVLKFPPRQPEFQPGSGHVGFMVDKMELGQVLSEYFGFPCQFAFHLLLHNHHHHLSSTTSIIGQTMAAVPSGLSLTPWERNILSEVGAASSELKFWFLFHICSCSAFGNQNSCLRDARNYTRTFFFTHSAYSSIFKIEAVPSSETSLNFYRTTRRNISEDITLHFHRRENHKCYKIEVSGWAVGWIEAREHKRT